MLDEHVVEIRFDTLNDIKEFYLAALHCEAPLFLMQGRYTIDPKSLLGIYSLDLSQNLMLAAAGNTVDLAKDFEKWLVK